MLQMKSKIKCLVYNFDNIYLYMHACIYVYVCIKTDPPNLVAVTKRF